MTDPSSEENKCWACKTPLEHKNQLKCLRCESWQRFPRRYLNFSVTFISALTGLFGVIIAGWSLHMTSEQQHRLDEDRGRIKVWMYMKSLVLKNKELTLNVDFKNQGQNVLYIVPTAECIKISGNGSDVIKLTMVAQQVPLPAYPKEIPSFAFEGINYYVKPSEEITRRQTIVAAVLNRLERYFTNSNTNDLRNLESGSRYRCTATVQTASGKRKPLEPKELSVTKRS